MGNIQHFLVIYNLRHHVLEDLRPFEDDAEAAMDAYADLEREFRDRADSSDYEIVLIGADSLETLKATHSRYFAPELSDLPFAIPT